MHNDNFAPNPADSKATRVALLQRTRDRAHRLYAIGELTQAAHLLILASAAAASDCHDTFPEADNV